ncbi:MAG: alternative ribosome rescue aminoacyl-tRNA hydrolase ArfB [Calditrichaceae bacterium]
MQYSDSENLIINDELAIANAEIIYTASRSGGPGGQHVNKVSSRVTLSFDVLNSHSLSEYQRSKIAGKLSTRINKLGILKVSSGKHRSQYENRRAATERFRELLRKALTDDPPRQKTRVPTAEKKRRLEEKRLKAIKKRSRFRNIDPDD